MARVGVVIPAYNAAATLGPTIESVLAQTYHDFEVVVVDDGSTDDTRAVAERYGDRVRVVDAGHNGVSAARNFGASETDSELIAFLDADDLWEPDKLETQVALLDERDGVGTAFAAITRVDGELNEIGVTPAAESDDFCRDLLLYSCIIPSSSSGMLVRRGVFDAVGGYDSRFSQCADWDILLRLSVATEFASAKKPLVRYRQWPGNMSSRIDLLERDTFAVLDAFYANSPPEPYRAIRSRVYSNHWMIVSGSYLHQGKLRDAVRCLWRGLSTDPANVGRVFGLPLRWARRLWSRAR